MNNMLAPHTKKEQNTIMFKNILMMAGLVAAVAPAYAAIEWTTDLEAAKTKAAAEGKSILIDFTGSDWCGYCIQLEKQVFNTPEFASFANDQFVYVQVDVPSNPAKIGAELYNKNQELCKQYKIAGFPTIMVMSPEGYVIGGFVGGSNMQRTKDSLSAALANAGKLKQAQQLQGSEQAKLMAEIHFSLPSDLQAANDAMVQVISEADTDNVTGVKDLAKAAKELEELEKKLYTTARNPEKAIPFIDEALKTCYPANRERLLEYKGQAIMAIINNKLQVAKDVKDIEEIKSLMLQLVDCAPADRKEAFRMKIEKDFANPEKVLKSIEQQRADRR